MLKFTSIKLALAELPPQFSMEMRRNVDRMRLLVEQFLMPLRADPQMAQAVDHWNQAKTHLSQLTKLLDWRGESNYSLDFGNPVLEPGIDNPVQE